MNKLTRKQKMLLEAIDYFISKYNYSPTYSELGGMLECSKENIFKRVLVLEKKGYISTKNCKCRTITIIKRDDF